METTNFKDIIGAANGDEEHVLGKFLYFSLSHLLVEKDALAELCDSLDIPHSVGNRVSVSDAFRSATGTSGNGLSSSSPAKRRFAKSIAATTSARPACIPANW